MLRLVRDDAVSKLFLQVLQVLPGGVAGCPILHPSQAMSVDHMPDRWPDMVLQHPSFDKLDLQEKFRDHIISNKSGHKWSPSTQD